MLDLESGISLFNKEILDRLLVETDKSLSAETDLILIGGTAVVLKYLSPRSTMDVDTYSAVSDELMLAWHKAEQKIGIRVPLSRSPISEGPYGMEERFVPYSDLNLKHLRIFLPDAADIVLMKVTRLFGRDRDDIAHLIKHSKISESLLLKRFREEMDHIVANPNTLRGHYLLVIEDNFGRAVAEKHERLILKKS